MIPQQVQQQIVEDLQLPSAPVSMLELGHRTPEFCRIADQAEHDLRQLLNLSQDYAILFLAGGASAQYAMVPFNLATPGDTLDYIDTGHWSKRAIEQAQMYANINVIDALRHNAAGQMTLLDSAQWEYSKQARYCHYVDNETLTGLEFPNDYFQTNCFLVCDMTSNILSREINMEPYGLIYAGAQKNIGTAGITIVIVRKDLLNTPSNDKLPHWENYHTQIVSESRYNTPPIFAWYVCGLVLAWTLAQGGVYEMNQRAEQKSRLVYEVIDASSLYEGTVAPHCRSRSNIHFGIADAKLEQRFIDESLRQGLYGLRGHKAVGGIRASLYNAMPIEGVETLVSFMCEFERNA